MQEQLLKEREQVQDKCPSMMNAFELITLSQGLNLSPLFDRRQVCYIILLPYLHYQVEREHVLFPENE